jgi:twinkle protein
MAAFADYGIDLPPGAHGEIDIQCPECSGQRRKSNLRDLSINVEKGTWFCQHCGWSGGLGKEADVLWPVVKMYQPPRPVPSVVAPTIWQNAVTWFASRGISAEVMARNHIAASEEFCPACENSVGTILFPYFRAGVHINTKHRCGRKHFRMEKGAERVLWGLPDIEGQKVAIWVEGEMDKLAVEMVGFTNCVSVPDGAPTPGAKSYSSKFAFLESAQDLLDSIDTHILICDEDAPGYALTEELSRRLGREKCLRGTFPDGIKDANQCLIEIGADELRRVITEAVPYPIDGVTTMSDLALDLDDLYDNGFDEGLRVGWPLMDQHYRVRTGLLTIVTGVPSHGKSSWLDQLLVEIITKHGWSIAICSPENQPLKRHAAGIIAKYLRKPFHIGQPNRMSRAEALEGRMFLDRYVTFVMPDDPTLDAILERAKALVQRKGIKGLVIDPWNEIEHGRPAHMSETEYTSVSLSQIRRFARVNDVHVWVVAHPTKMPKTTDGSEPVPTLWDISGSAHFKNKADYGISVWRDVADTSAPNQVHVTKVRFQETGKLGMVNFWYEYATGMFREDRAVGYRARGENE